VSFRRVNGAGRSRSGTPAFRPVRSRLLTCRGRGCDGWGWWDGAGRGGQLRSKGVTASGSAVNGLAHSEVAPVIGWASVTTVNGLPG